MPANSSHTSQIAVIGAGIAGLAGALMLKRFGLTPTLITESLKVPQSDPRSFALAHSSIRILSELGVQIKNATPVHRIILSRTGKLRSIRLCAEHLPSQCFGYMVSAYDLNKELLRLAKQINTLEAKVTNAQPDGERILLELDGASSIDFDHVILATGANSKLKKKLRFSQVEQPSTLSAVIGLFSSNRNHLNCAYERSGRGSLIALLPQSKSQYKCVAMMKHQCASALNNQADLESYIQSFMGFRAGALKVASDPVLIQLKRSSMAQSSLKNVFAIGDAAFALIPAGAQGLNTGLKLTYELALRLSSSAQKDESKAYRCQNDIAPSKHHNPHIKARLLSETLILNALLPDHMGDLAFNLAACFLHTFPALGNHITWKASGMDFLIQRAHV